MNAMKELPLTTQKNKVWMIKLILRSRGPVSRCTILGADVSPEKFVAAVQEAVLNRKCSRGGRGG
jgi:hypothetical protein